MRPNAITPSAAKPPCTYCGVKPSYCRGYCQACYSIVKRRGTPERLITPGKRCSHAGCENPVKSKSLCHKHYTGSHRNPLKERWFAWRRWYAKEWPSRWNDYEAFVADVGGYPGGGFRLRKKHPEKPLCGANVHWVELYPVDTRNSEDPAEYRRQLSRLRRYGISPSAYRDMLDRQGGKCACCRQEHQAHKFSPFLCVDHCHETGKVRGLLCSLCNTAIGHFRENPDLLVEGLRYLAGGRADVLMKAMSRLEGYLSANDDIASARDSDVGA